MKNNMDRTVGRESEAHPAFSIIPSPEAERRLLPPIHGDKYRFERNGGSLNKANPPPLSGDCVLPGELIKVIKGN